MKPIEGIFGEHSWDDLRSEVTARVRSRYRQVSPEMVEDAVSEAIGDVLGYWVWLPSSVVEDDPGLTFRGALRHAHWKASRYILRELNRPDRTTFTDLQAELDDASDEDFGDYLDSLMVDTTALDPAEEAEESDLKARARRLLDDISARERERWANDWTAGKPASVAAKEHGIDERAMQLRYQRGIARLVGRATEYGIVP